jgi:PPM family protein phosphatase
MYTWTESPMPAPPARADAAPLRLRAALRSDIGGVRERNEDAAHADLAGQLFMVADGIGGHVAGEVASAMAVELVRRELEAARGSLAALAAQPGDPARQQIGAILERAIRTAHAAVLARGRTEPEMYRMGTTLDVALILGRELFVAHVGDSRTYLIRDGVAIQITRDHTMAEVLRRSGRSDAEVEAAPARHIVLSAIGVKERITIDIVHRTLQHGDRLLLCSDGLHQYFAPREIAAALRRPGEPELGLSVLVEQARSRGGEDNITGVVVELQGRRPHPNTIPRPLTPGPVPTAPVRLPRPVHRAPTAPPLSRELFDDEKTVPSIGSAAPRASP